jgi:hypothetical protein
MAGKYPAVNGSLLTFSFHAYPHWKDGNITTIGDVVRCCLPRTDTLSSATCLLPRFPAPQRASFRHDLSQRSAAQHRLCSGRGADEPGRRPQADGAIRPASHVGWECSCGAAFSSTTATIGQPEATKSAFQPNFRKGLPMPDGSGLLQGGVG